MSAATATLIAGVLAILGTLLGLVTERALRSWGRIQCEPSHWQVSYLNRDPRGGEASWYGAGEVPLEEALAVEYSVHLALFNGKEIPVALREIKIAFVCEDGRDLVSTTPEDTDAPPRGSGIYPPVYVINLPPRQYVHMKLQGGLAEEEVSILARSKWDRVEFVGRLPDRYLRGRQTYRRVIATP